VYGQEADRVADEVMQMPEPGCSGQSLSKSERAYFEPRFGANFNQVRLHSDTQAAKSARAVNAKADTT
jgi:hypothetical protein